MIWLTICPLVAGWLNILKCNYLYIAEIIGLDGSSHRVRRDVNWNLNFDVTEAIAEIFEGIGNIFNSPRLYDLQQNQQEIIKMVNGTAAQIKFLQQDNLDLSHQVESVFEAMYNVSNNILAEMDDVNRKIEDLAKIELFESIVDESIDNLQLLINALPYLLRNRIPPSLLNPKEAEDIFMLAEEYATNHGLRLVISNPMELYNLNVSVFTTQDNWMVDLHIPMINEKNAFSLKRFINVPFTMQSEQHALQLDLATNDEDILVGLKPGLEQDYRYFFADQSDCQTFTSSQKLSLCSVRTNRGIEKTCLPALLSESPIEPVCYFTNYYDSVWGPKIFGNHKLIVYVDKETELFLRYPNSSYDHFIIPRGRYITETTPGLVIYSNKWDYEVPAISSLGLFQIRQVKIEDDLVNANWTNEVQPLSRSMLSLIEDHVKEVIEKRKEAQNNQEEFQNITSEFDNGIKQVVVQDRVQRNEILSSVGVGVGGMCLLLLVAKFVFKIFKK